MKKILLFFSAICITQLLPAQDTIPEKLDKILTTYMKCNKFNGSVLVARSGKVLLAKGYGYKNVEDKTWNDEHTIFQIGSMTKTFTATVILKLVSQKKLALTDKLSKYFPTFPKGDNITIKNLLTHTSGIFNYTDVYDFWAQSMKPTNKKSVLDSIMKRPLLFSPGEKFSYSNSNYMLLAYIIQKITGQSFETIVTNWIFKPLKMLESGFDFTGLHDKDKAKGYWNFSAAKLVEGPHNDSSEFIGSGEIYSTVIDLYKWHEALQESKVLDKKMLDQAYQQYKGAYGYGWEMDTIGGKRTVGHGGRVFGFECSLIRVPEDDVCIILLNNNSDGPYLHAIGQKIMSVIYGQSYSLPEQPLDLSEEKLKPYAGMYVSDDHHNFEVKLINGHLFGMESPEHSLELLPLTNNRFIFMEHEGEEGVLTFEMDENGLVKQFSTINSRGMKLTIKKVNK